MNIGIFSDTYYPIINGVSTSVMMLKKELTKQGHTVYIFTTSNPESEPEENVFRLPSMPFYFLKNQRVAMLYPPKLLVKVKNLDLDIIHTQTEFPLGILGKIVSEMYKIPLVHTYHTMYEDYVHYIGKGHLVTADFAKKYSRIFCNRADAVITPVEKSKKSLIGYGVNKPINVVPTGIDFKAFKRGFYSEKELAETKEELNLDPESPILVSIGRMGKEKSLDVVINEMPKIIDKIPNLKLVVIGDGPVLDELKNQALELGVENSVIFAGSKPWASIGKYYQIGDLFISASTSETQGLTYLESMAAGTPVVAKKDPSLEGVLEHNVTGFYFENNDDITETVVSALNDKEQLNKIIANAYENIQNLSSEKFGENLEKLYKKIINDFQTDKELERAKWEIPSSYMKTYLKNSPKTTGDAKEKNKHN